MQTNLIKLSKDEIKTCLDWGVKIHALKDSYKSTKNLTTNPHGIGKIGELAFAKFCPLLTKTDVDFSIQTSGDKLDFFGKVDIKTTEYYKYPILKENKSNKTDPLSWYVLAAYNSTKQEVAFKGFVRAANFLTRANFYDNFKGCGPKFVLQSYKLNQNWQELWKILQT